MLKKIRSILPVSIQSFLRRIKQKKDYNQWCNGKPSNAIPHRTKQLIIAYHQLRSGYDTLVETGTYYGDMIYSNLHQFRNIHSIELSEHLFKAAQKRFKTNNNVYLYEGDSGKVLGDILTSIKSPIIFWLDGHYSGGITAKGELECPIVQEIFAIARSPQKDLKPILLIDDVHCFTGNRDYPSIDELKQLVQNQIGLTKFEIIQQILICSSDS